MGVWTDKGPASPCGYLIIGERDAEKFIPHDGYVFRPVELPEHRSCDTRQVLRLYEYNVAPERSSSFRK